MRHRTFSNSSALNPAVLSDQHHDSCEVGEGQQVVDPEQAVGEVADVDEPLGGGEEQAGVHAPAQRVPQHQEPVQQPQPGRYVPLKRTSMLHRSGESVLLIKHWTFITKELCQEGDHYHKPLHSTTPFKHY